MTPPVTSRRQWRRLQEISTVLWSSGFGWLVDAAGLRVCVSVRCRVSCTVGVGTCPHHVAMDRPLPERLVTVLEELGPTAVKLGQLLATRTGELPPAYTEALKTLHDAVRPFSGQEARLVLAEELGRPVGEVFAELDEEPLAAASLSQVHRGRLHDGTEVAVKIQRPRVQEQIEADLALLRWAARRLERRRGHRLPFQATALVDELADHTLSELDFRHEARSAAAVRRLFGPGDGVVVPQVHWGATTRRILTMDLVRGVRPAPRKDLVERGLDPDRLLLVGARAELRQVFELGLFHADPHPGNLLLLEGDRVAFLDFGLTGRLDRRERRRMAMVLYALGHNDFETVGDQLLHVSSRKPGADLRRFRTALAELVEEWYESGTRVSMARLLVQELGLGARFGIVFPRELLLLARALVHLESTAAVIDPERSFADLVAPLLPELRETMVPGRGDLERLWNANRLDYLALALELPEDLPHLRDRLQSPDVATPRDGRGGRMAAGAAGGAMAVAVLEVVRRMR